MLNTAYPDNTCNPQTTEHNTVDELRDMQTLDLQQSITRLGFPTILTPGQATLEDIQLHAILRQRLSPTTAHNRITTLQRITNHPSPINLADPTLEQWIRHSDYREQIENATHALHNEWKAIRTLLKAYNIPIWNYQPPTLPGRQRRTIQKPETIRQMIHTRYTGQKHIDTHLQYILLATYMIGLRNPSETALLQTTDVDLDIGIITITEPKKRGSTRDVYPTPQYMTGRNCKSLRNWIDHIRPRYTSQHSQEALFITLQGHPFTKNYLRKYLTENIKPKYPEYQPYLCRHWAATAKLIQEYITTKNWNKPRVQRWLGHEHETTTDTYISQAENYLRRYPFDWFHHVLKKPTTKVWGKHGEKSQNGEKRLCDTELLPLTSNGPVGVLTLPTGENKIDVPQEIFSVILWEPINIIGEGPQNNVGFFTFSFEQTHCPHCDDEPIFLDLPPYTACNGSSSPTITVTGILTIGWRFSDKVTRPSRSPLATISNITVTKNGGNWFGDQLYYTALVPAPHTSYNNIIVTGNNMEYGSVTGQTSFLLAVVPFIDHTPFIMNHQDVTDILFSLPSNIFEDILPGGSPSYLDSTWDQMPSEGNVLTQNGSYLGTDPSKPFNEIIYHGDIQPQNNIVYPRKYCIQFFLKDNCGWTHKDSVADGNQKGIPDQLFLNGGSCISPIVGFDWYPHNPYICCTEEDNHNNIQHCMLQNYINHRRQSSKSNENERSAKQEKVKSVEIAKSSYVKLCYVFSFSLINIFLILSSLIVYKSFDIHNVMLCYLWRCVFF